MTSRVRKIFAGNEYLQLICEPWRPNTRPSRNKQDKVSDIKTNNFPYLDLEFLWNDDMSERHDSCI